MDHPFPPWLVKPLLSYAKQHPIHAACYCLLGGVATFKFGSFMYLRLRSYYLHPKDPHDKLHSYPHPSKPKLPHGNKSMAYIADIQDSEAGIALLHEIKRSQSFLTLHSPGGLAGGEDGEDFDQQQQQQQGLSLGDSPSRLLRPEADVLQFMQDISRLGDMLKTHHKIYLHSLMTSRVLEEGDTLMTEGQDAIDGLHLIVSGRLGVVDVYGGIGRGGGGGISSGGGGITTSPSPTPPPVSRSSSHPTLSHSFSYYPWEGSDTFGSTFGGKGGEEGGNDGSYYGRDDDNDEEEDEEGNSSTPNSKWGGDLLCVFEAGTSLGENAVFAGGLPFFSAGGSAGVGGGGTMASISSSSMSNTGIEGGAGALPPWRTPLMPPPPPPPPSQPAHPTTTTTTTTTRVASSPHWLPFLGSTRPSTVVALEPTAVLTLSAPAFSRFSATYPEAAMSLILESSCRQWRVANNLLVDYFMLEDAWRASLEPPGSDPAFSFAAPAAPSGMGMGMGRMEEHTSSATTTSPGLSSSPPPLFPSPSSSGWGAAGAGATNGAAAATPLTSLDFSSPHFSSSSSSSSSSAPPPLPPSLHRPLYAPPVSLPIRDVEAAADGVITLPPGVPVYCEGDDSDALYLVLEGYGSCWHLGTRSGGGGGGKKMGRRGVNGKPSTASRTSATAAAPANHSSGASSGPPRPVGMPSITSSESVAFAKAAARAAAASAVAGGAQGAFGSSSSSSSTLPPITLFRYVGPGCLSGGPACLNFLPHRETLLTVTPMRLAVFKRSTFAALASSESGGWGGGGGVRGGGGVGPFTPPSTPTPTPPTHIPTTTTPAAYSTANNSSTPRPSLLPSSPAAPPLPPSAHHHHHHHHHHATTLPIPLVQLHIALAVARTMVALPRMLLALGMRRTWAACGESIFTEGEASNGMYFIVSGRVRCEMRAGKRLAHYPSPHPYAANPSPNTPSPTSSSSSSTTTSHSKKRTGLSMFGGAAAAAAAGGGVGGGRPSPLLSPTTTNATPSPSPSSSSSPIPLTTTPAAPFLVHFDVPAGGTVGELSVLAKETTRASTAYAARDCELVHISAQSFARLASTYASVYEHFTAALAKRVGDTTRALVRGGGGWGASSGAPGFLGVEKAVGIPFSLPAPPPPSLTLGGGGYNHHHHRHRQGGGRGGGGGGGGGGGLRWRKYKYTAAPPTSAVGAAEAPGAAAAAATLFLPPAPPTTINQAWSSVHPSLVPFHPCAPSFSTLTLVSGGGTPLPKGALAAFAVRLGEALAAAAAGEEEEEEGGVGGGGGRGRVGEGALPLALPPLGVPLPCQWSL